MQMRNLGHKTHRGQALWRAKAVRGANLSCKGKVRGRDGHRLVLKQEAMRRKRKAGRERPGRQRAQGGKITGLAQAGGWQRPARFSGRSQHCRTNAETGVGIKDCSPYAQQRVT